METRILGARPFSLVNIGGKIGYLAILARCQNCGKSPIRTARCSVGTAAGRLMAQRTVRRNSRGWRWSCRNSTSDGCRACRAVIAPRRRLDCAQSRSTLEPLRQLEKRRAHSGCAAGRQHGPGTDVTTADRPTRCRFRFAHHGQTSTIDATPPSQDRLRSPDIDASGFMYCQHCGNRLIREAASRSPSPRRIILRRHPRKVMQSPRRLPFDQTEIRLDATKAVYAVALWCYGRDGSDGDVLTLKRRKLRSGPIDARCFADDPWRLVIFG